MLASITFENCEQMYFHLCHFTNTPPHEITVMTVPFVTPHDLDPPHDDALDSHPEFLFLCYAFMYTGFWRPVASMCLGSVVLPAYACKIKDFIITSREHTARPWYPCHDFGVRRRLQAHDALDVARLELRRVEERL